MVCQHCQKNRVARPRKLCWSCYYNPGVRGRYPPIVLERLSPGTGRRRKPCEPTDAIPGTPEKIRVLMERAERGEELFHEADPCLSSPLLSAAAG